MILIHSVNTHWGPTVRKVRHKLWGHTQKRGLMPALEERTVKVEENNKHQKCPKLLGVFYKFTASLKVRRNKMRLTRRRTGRREVMARTRGRSQRGGFCVLEGPSPAEWETGRVKPTGRGNQRGNDGRKRRSARAPRYNRWDFLRDGKRGLKTPMTPMTPGCLAWSLICQDWKDTEWV